ncbi:MAG TPA: Crp/Fnr family transcriptional regulator [Thermomicrobiales bacterium]|nr:Crp/Fnr family transcriptional regulator [Thermomicrobiales bacterium]
MVQSAVMSGLAGSAGPDARERARAPEAGATEGCYMLDLHGRCTFIDQTGAALLRQCSARLAEADTRICALQTEPVERRLGEALRRLAAAIGTPAAAGIALDLPLTRQGLGDLCGATESTVSRTLNAWARRGVIAIDRQRIVLLRPDELPAHDEGAPPDGRAAWSWYGGGTAADAVAE